MKKFVFLLGLIFALPAMGQNKFADLVGPIGVQPVQNSKVVTVPTITWGGDVPFYVANGFNKTTQNGSIYNKLGLNINLVNNDDFVQQVRDYLAGKSPFIRGTFHMLGLASEVLNSDPRTKPQIFLQISYSQGDHVVGRETIRNLNDLKNFKQKHNRKPHAAIQQGGPHVGLVDDMLKTAQMTWEDIDVTWVTSLSGPNSPAESFRNNDKIDFCTVITPDMLGLTTGLDAEGTGAEGTVKGAKVFVSTAQMSRSVVDVLAVRKDWADQNKPFLEKYVAGYFKACEDVTALRRQFNESNNLTPEYKKVLTIAQNVFGTTVIPTLEVDGHGLLLDCSFVGLAGNESFFTDKGNLNGFDRKMAASLDLAVNLGYAKARNGFDPIVLNYPNLATIAGIKYEQVQNKERIVAEATQIDPEENLDDRTIVSFTISFEPNQQEFSVDQYGAEFNRAIETAASFGNAIVVIRGHSDPTQTIIDLLKAGIAKNIINRTGQKGNYKYFINDGSGSKPLQVESIPVLVKHIKDGAFDGTTPNPRETMQAALTLSFNRANAVKAAVANYAKVKGVNLDVSQVQPVGAGISEPVISKPKDLNEAKQNMRVEFRIVKVPAEAVKSEDFDY